MESSFGNSANMTPNIFRSTETPGEPIDRQRFALLQKEAECYRSNLTSTPPATGLYCPLFWDKIYCWPYVRAGTTHEIPCPDYVNGFITGANASRFCTEDGTWYINQSSNLTWSNYSQCLNRSEIRTPYLTHPGTHNFTLIGEYVPVIKTVSKIGYTISLSSLLIAFFILAFIKRLRCPRNNLHMHLFVSFIFRAFITLLKDNIMIAGIGLPSNLIMADGKPVSFNDDEKWDCKILISIWHYFLVANYFWILMEGLYLHNLIFFALFSDNSGILLYVILGWGLPLLFIIPWAVLRITYDNTHCWAANTNLAIFWTLRGPITISIVINFIFFLNITRILFLKLKSSYLPDSRSNRYKKLGRSTLVLVPLFGVHYTMFLGMSSVQASVHELREVVWLFCDQFFTAFQGFFVSILYCFLNGEIQAELCKKWQRWNLSRGKDSNSRSSIMTQSLTYFSKNRNSLHSLTTSAVNSVVDPLKKECRSTSPSPKLARNDGLSCLHRNTTPSPKGGDVLVETSIGTTWSYCPKLSDTSLNCDKSTSLLQCPSPGDTSCSMDRLVSPTPTLSTPVIDRISLSPMAHSDAAEDSKLLGSPMHDQGQSQKESIF